MNKNYQNLYGAIILISLLCAGCSNPLHSPVNNTNTKKNDNVTIHIINGTEGRTLLPEEPLFCHYEFTFIPEDGQEGHERVTTEDDHSSSVSVGLAAGRWTINAYGYVYISGVDGIEDNHYIAANGSASLIVGGESSQSVSIDLQGGVQPGEQGVFAYTARISEEISGAVARVRTF
jgi:hypothetical protein